MTARVEEPPPSMPRKYAMAASVTPPRPAASALSAWGGRNHSLKDRQAWSVSSLLRHEVPWFPTFPAKALFTGSGHDAYPLVEGMH
jgi:hypothetical protein